MTTASQSLDDAVDRIDLNGLPPERQLQIRAEVRAVVEHALDEAWDRFTTDQNARTQARMDDAVAAALARARAEWDADRKALANHKLDQALAALEALRPFVVGELPFEAVRALKETT